MPPFEEGLIVPTFGLDPEADSRVLPDFDRAAAAVPPAPENPGQGFLGNLRGSFGGGTITGALANVEAQRLARGGTPTRAELTRDPVGAGIEGLVLAPEPELTVERATEIRAAAEREVLEQTAYDLSPTKITGSGLAGAIAGQVLDPVNALTFGGGALASRLAAAGYSKAAQAAATMAVQAGAQDIGTQAIRTASGAQEHIEKLEAALAPVASGLLGGGGHALVQGAGAVGGLLKENLKGGVGSVIDFVRARAAQREALGVDLPREALPGGSAARAEEPAPQPAALTGQSGQSAATARTDLPAEPLREAEPARGMPAAEPDPTAPVSREQADGRAEGPLPAEEPQPGPVPDGAAPAVVADPVAAAARAATDVPRAEPIEPRSELPGNPDDVGVNRSADSGLTNDSTPADVSPAEPPPLSPYTKANWDDLRPASAPDAPAWAPRIQGTFDELARGFGVEPPRLSVGKAKFPDEPLFGANDRRGNIVLAEGMSEHHALNNAMHEFGHEVQFRLYDQAPEETRAAIQEAFRTATARDAGATSLNQLRPVTATRKLGDAGQRRSVKGVRTGDDPIPAGTSAANYQHGFEEWFAEQVSRWVTQDAKPVGVVERFFSGIADAWRRIYERVTGHTPLAPEMRAFLDGRWEGAEAGGVGRELPIDNGRGKFELVPADHDELGMVKPGKVDDRLYRIVRDGEPVGYTNVRIDGDTADVRDIFTHLGGGDISLSRGVFGPRAVSQIMRQFLAENPEVRRLVGERVSGARRGGAHGLAGTGEKIEVAIPERRRGQAVGTEPTTSPQEAAADAFATRAAPKVIDPTAARSGKPLSLSQYIARNGGLALDGEARARDLNRVFVPGGGPLARAKGRSIDGHWREDLIAHGYLPPDADGMAARDVRKELFDALDRERRGDRVYSAHDQVPEKGGVDNQTREIEAEARKITKAMKAVGLRAGDVDQRTMMDAAEMLWRGDADDPLVALEHAMMAGEEPAQRVQGQAVEGQAVEGLLFRKRPGKPDPLARLSAALDARPAGAPERERLAGLLSPGRPATDPIADLERALAAQGIAPPPALGLPTAPETGLMEAATRLHGLPAERAVPLDELRAALPGQSAAEVDRALAALAERGVARVDERGVRLDPGAVREVHAATERYVQEEAGSIGRELFGPREPPAGVGKAPEILERGRRAPAGTTVEEPDMIRQGRPVEDQGTAPIEGDARPARLEEMAQRLAAEFETVLRTGRVAPGARGQFDTQTGVARVRSLSDLDTALHEIGHSLQQSPQTAGLVEPVIARNRAELAPLGAGTGKIGDAEAFAELFRLYATNRAYAARAYPGATADLERALATDLPRQAAALDRLRGELDTIARAPSGAVVGSDVITPKPDGVFRRILDMFGADFVGAAATDPRGGVFYAWRDALYTHMLSPHHPINRAMEVFGRIYRENTGKVLDLLPQDDAYILARIGSGSRAVAEHMLNHGVRGARSDETVGPGLRDAIETAIGRRYTAQQWHDFGAYLTARSMVADYERFAAGEIPNPPGRLSAGDYAKAVQEFEAKYPTFADGASQYYEFNRNFTQRHFDLGIFSKAYYDAAMARKDYAPKMRDMEDLGAGVMSGGGGRRDGASMMKTFRGSQRSVINPLDSTVKKVFDLEAHAALNETKAALARVAEIAGPGSGFIAEPVPANKLSSIRVDVLDAMRAAGNRANLDHLDLEALIHQAEGLLGDDVFAHIFRQEPIRPGMEPITFYFVNGERRALRLADGAYGRELYNALNVMTAPERNIFLSVLQISGAVLKQGVTKSLGFVYRNFTRDQGTSVATGGRGYLPFISALKGGFDAVRGGGDFEKYLSFGGFAGGVIHEAVESGTLARGGAQRMFREKNIVSRALGTGAKLAELSEAATRAGLFQSYVKQAEAMGFDAYNAALYATFKANDYIDFRKVGSHVAPFARAIPFLNASAQGTDKEARALFGDMVRLETKRFRGEELSRIELDNLRDSRAAWVKTLAWGMLFGGGTAYLNSDNPEWFGAAGWRRERGYNFFPAGPDGHWLSSPKPFGFVRNISDLFEYGVEYLIRHDPTIGTKVLHALADAHSLPYTNPIIDLYYGLRANYDTFRDRPIVPPSLQGVEAAEQYTRYTSEIAKGIGRVTGWSPMKVDYAAKNLGGGTAIDFLRNADTLIHWMQGKPGGKEKTAWDLPLFRELTQNLQVGNDATTRFYGLVGQKVGTLEQATTTYGQKINAGDRTGAADFLRRQPDAERAYAVLMKTTFDAEDKLMHPLVLARAYNDVIGGVSRALGNDNLLPEGDLDRKHVTFSRNQLQPIHVDGPTTEKLRNELDALSMVTARNALIATGAEGMQGVPVKDSGEFLDRIRMLSPDVARELRGRLAAKRLYDPAVVAERWPEVRARLLKDGAEAEFNDLLPRRARSTKRERKRALADE